VLPLVAERVAGRRGLPADLAEAVRVEARRAAAVDLVREAELRLVLETLSAASVAPLLMKGAQLAYTHYARPDLRPRLDTDLLIAEDDRMRAVEVLEAHGYEPAPQVTGELVISQTCLVKRREGAILHAVDVHWRLANPRVFAEALTYGELAQSAVPVPRLSPVARGLSDVHALLLACVHRVAHHFDAVHLIWLQDIHLLASTLSATQWREFAGLAADRGLASVTRRSLTRAQQLLGTRVPAEVDGILRARADRADEPTSAYVELTPRSRNEMQVFLSDFHALPWRLRVRLIRQHVFPPAQYMRGVYAPESRVPLYLLYARRAFRGARKWLSRG